MNKGLSGLLLKQCKQKGLSLRGLSLNCGLSASTVHGIITRNYQPTLYSLNRLADYLGIKREYLWQLSGLLEDMGYGAQTTFGDPRLRFQFAQADRLPEAARNLLISVIEVIIRQTELHKEETTPREERVFSLSGNNKGLPCPFKPILCQEGYCKECQIYLDWQKQGEIVVMCSWCGKVIDRKPGLGQAGVSHGICDDCKQKNFPDRCSSPQK